MLVKWRHDEKRRYYTLHLTRDLFDQWSLVCDWGSLDTQQGRLSVKQVESYEAGLSEIKIIGQRRTRRGYAQIVK